VIVAANRIVEFLDIGFVEFHTRLLFHPVFELRIARLVVFDEIEGFLAVETESVQDHLVEAFAAARISSGQFAARFQRCFEPKAWQV
jgi:hypothetical protein